MSRMHIHEELLKDQSGTDISSYALTSGTAVTSAALEARSSTGFAMLAVTLAGASDDVDITYELSNDKITWYSTIVDSNGTALNTVYTTLGQGTSYIQLALMPAKYIRFKLDPDANSTITAKYIQQERT